MLKVFFRVQRHLTSSKSNSMLTTTSTVWHQRSKATAESATKWNIGLNSNKLHRIRRALKIEEHNYFRLYSLAISMVLVIYVGIFPDEWASPAQSFLPHFAHSTIWDFMDLAGTGMVPLRMTAIRKLLLSASQRLKPRKWKHLSRQSIGSWFQQYGSNHAKHASGCVHQSPAETANIDSTERHMYLFPVFMVGGTKPIIVIGTTIIVIIIYKLCVRTVDLCHEWVPLPLPSEFAPAQSQHYAPKRNSSRVNYVATAIFHFSVNSITLTGNSEDTRVRWVIN